MSERYEDVVPAAEISLDDFTALYPRETDRIEFKEGVGEALRRTMVAFMNTQGGDVLIGVDDTGRVLGLPDPHAVVAKVHRAVQNIREVGRYDVTILHVGPKRVVRVRIHPRVRGFAQLSDGVILVRRGESDDPVFGTDLVNLVTSRSMHRYEIQPVSISLDEVDPALLDDLAGAHGWLPEVDIADRLRERLLLHAESDRLTLAGALFLAPHDVLLGKAYIDIRRYLDDGDAYNKRLQITGPVHIQVRNATEEVLDELGTDFVVSGTHRFEMARLPEVVIREAIANAVAHRSYEMAGSATVVEIRPTRVVVRSPGGLPEGVTVQNLRHASSARNQAVLDVLRRFHVAEDAGRGVDMMQDTMAAELLDPPRFTDHGHSFEVTLPVHSPITLEERAWVHDLEGAVRVTPTDRLVLVHAARGERVTNSVVRTVLGVDSVAARAALRRLCDAGLLRQSGTRGGATYVLADDIRPVVAAQLGTEQVLDIVARHAERTPLTNRIVREITGLDRAEALALLDRLVRDNRLRREGTKRGTRYVLP